MVLLENSQDLLGTLVLGNSLANSLLVTMGLLTLLDENTTLSWGWGMGVLALTLLLCEVAPKTLGVRDPEKWSVWVAGPIHGLLRLLRWVHHLAQGLVDGILKVVVPKSVEPLSPLSEEEYTELIELAHQQGALAAFEKEILLHILSLDRRTAGDVMKPRSQIVMLPDDAPLDEMIALARTSRHARIPLYDETPDTIVGLLNTRTLLLQPGVELWEAVEFPSFVPESMNLLNLLEALQRQKRGLAIVVDEFGGVAGVISMEDILEYVVGEIRNEGEVPGFFSDRIGPGKWRASGNLRIDDFRREYPDLGEVSDVDTLGGLVLQLAEVVPSVGERFLFRGLRFTVKSADERNVRELHIEKIKDH